jgi:S-formylglutathione hydrolase FrmB
MGLEKSMHAAPYGPVRRAFHAPALLALALLVSCGKSQPPERPDHPRLTPGVRMLDRTFHSAALNRDMQYRVVLPANLPAGRKLPVFYLLHGGGEGFRDWTNDSDAAGFAEKGLILVMPEAASSYYMNSVDHPQDRYEDYIVQDLIAEVESQYPVAAGRSNRAIAGVSMGGFGAVVLALKHPDLFVFAGGLSSALDVPTRPFSIKRVDQWRRHTSIFGPAGSQSRKQNDPYTLARSSDPATAPYLFLACGEQEGLLPANRRFAALLSQRHFRYEFHAGPGGHNWNQWNPLLPSLIDSAMAHLSPAAAGAQTSAQ